MDRVSKAERELVRKIQKQTNADRIRAMTDEELAEFCWTYGGIGVCPPIKCTSEKCGAEKCWLDWLKQEATNES